jgi:hypothetical protein
VPCGNDDEEDIALPAPLTRKPEVAVKQDATPVMPEHMPADGYTFDNENENGQSSRAKISTLTAIGRQSRR